MRIVLYACRTILCGGDPAVGSAQRTTCCLFVMLSIPVVHRMHANLRYRPSTFLVVRDLSSATTGNSGNPPPPGKPVGLRAQYDKEGSGSELTGEFMVVTTNTRKCKGNGVGKEPVWRSKRARHLPLDDASDGGDTCPKWCRGDNSLPARMQQARCHGRAIWA